MDEAVVYLVGAGPGDVGLLSVVGRELLSRADVVVYDYLANREMLRWVRDDTEVIYAGKQAGYHTMKQEQINQLLIDKAHQGKMVVRLKGGDPFVFGRGGEEALALSRAGIRLQVVPGVTAGVAVPAYAGIPVTHRDCASAVAFITGHKAKKQKATEHIGGQREGDSGDIDWAGLARWRGTLVFYMAIGNLQFICDKLQQEGMADDIPAAVITNGCSAQQQVVIGDMSNIYERVTQQGLRPPGLLVVGQVVRLREELQWFENKPLFGRRVIVTRPANQATEMAGMLAGLGAEPLVIPVIRIEPVDDDILSRFLLGSDGVGVSNSRMGYDWLVFSSVNGVRVFFDVLDGMGYDGRFLAGVQVAAVGPATAKCLREYGIRADLVPAEYTTEAIGREIIQRVKEAGKAKSKNMASNKLGRANKDSVSDGGLNATGRVLLWRAGKANDALPICLREAGFEVDVVAAYNTCVEKSYEQQLREAVVGGGVSWVTFTSPSTVENFLKMVPIDMLVDSSIKIASIGPVTSAAIKQAGLSVAVQAREYTVNGLIDALVEYEK